jgi:CheY-like chemotaxis protein
LLGVPDVMKERFGTGGLYLRPHECQSSSRARSRILIACSQSELQDLVAPAVLRLGHEMVAVYSGYELVTRVVQSLLYPSDSPAPSLIIASQTAPQLRGLDALARVRRCGTQTPAILLCKDLSELEELPESVQVVEQPLEPDELAEHILRALERSDPRTRSGTNRILRKSKSPR